MEKTRKGLITLIAIALLAPVTLMAQGEPPDRPFGGAGHGSCLMEQRHPGPHGGGNCVAPDGHRDRGKWGGGIGHLLMAGDKIGLTDEQRDRLKEMQLEFKMAGIDRKAELQKAKVQLRALMRDPDAAEGDVMRAIDEASRLKAEMQKSRYQHRKAIKAVLTDEQIEKLKELRKSHREEMGKRGPGPMGRPGGHGGRGHP